MVRKNNKQRKVSGEIGSILNTIKALQRRVEGGRATVHQATHTKAAKGVRKTLAQGAQSQRGRKAVSSITRNNSDAAEMYTRSLTLAGVRNRPKQGVPFFNVASSVKARHEGTYTVTVCNSGYGFFVFSPVTVNDTPSICYTNNQVTYVTDTLDNNQAGVASANATSLPYAGADVTRGVRGRIISCGVKAYYSGTLLNRSGVWYCYRDPANLALGSSTSTITIPSLSSRKNCLVSPVGSDPVYHSALPIDADMLEYTNSYVPFNASTNLNEQIVCVAMSGQPGQTFTVDFTLDVEYTGAATEATGTDNVTSSLPAGAVIAKAQASHNSMVKCLSEGKKIAETSVSIVKNVSKVASVLAPFFL